MRTGPWFTVCYLIAPEELIYGDATSDEPEGFSPEFSEGFSCEAEEPEFAADAWWLAALISPLELLSAVL